MLNRRRFAVAIFTGVVSLALAPAAPRLRAADLPAALTDGGFWRLTKTFVRAKRLVPFG